MLLAGMVVQGCSQKEPTTESNKTSVPQEIDTDGVLLEVAESELVDDWESSVISSDAPTHVTDAGVSYPISDLSDTTGLTRMTETPFLAYPGGSMPQYYLCGIPEGGFDEPADHDHLSPMAAESEWRYEFQNISIHVYMNEPARLAFAERGGYPEGSRVVKVKTSDGEFEGIGGMIKREKGYDSAGGDWEYFYQDTKSQVARGKILSCARCHAARIETDSIFGSWANAEPTEPPEDWSTTIIVRKHVTDTGIAYPFHELTATKELIRMTTESIRLDGKLDAMCGISGYVPPSEESRLTYDFIAAMALRAGENPPDPLPKDAHVYMNDSAREAFAHRGPYPAGSHILKVKFLHNEFAGVAGMLKREKGYDPERGDWEYIYQDTEARFSRGKIAKCSNCHAARIETDGVFGSWANAEPAEQKGQLN